MFEVFDTYNSSYLMTTEEPKLHGYTHEYIKSVLDSWQYSNCLSDLFMCDEKVISTGKMRTYVYVVFHYDIPAHVLSFLFPFARITPVKCSHYEVRNYLLKHRSYSSIRAFVEPLPDSFEEWLYVPGVKGGEKRG